ncbi:30S ribosomal protein S13 [Erythrobacter sp. SD-21]|nr:30S ribosomal protein S13 [Erythrobacter sp. SD-21]
MGSRFERTLWSMEI